MSAQGRSRVPGPPPPAPRPPPRLDRTAHKGIAGQLLIAAGSRAMPGAAILVARAAQRAGAGLVAVTSIDGELDIVLPIAAPEAILVRLVGPVDRPTRGAFPELAGRSDAARAIGPGLGTDARARALVEALLALGGPLVLDADGLNHFAGRVERLRAATGALVLTPHPGEAQRLLERPIPSDDRGRLEAAGELAQRAGAIVVLKGAGTVVASAEGGEVRAWVNPTGNPGLATAGSGDVLTGILGAYLCRLGPAFDAFDAARAAVWVHGRAGDYGAAVLGERALIASDLVDWLPRAQIELEGE